MKAQKTSTRKAISSRCRQLFHECLDAMGRDQGARYRGLLVDQLLKKLRDPDLTFAEALHITFSFVKSCARPQDKACSHDEFAAWKAQQALSA